MYRTAGMPAQGTSSEGLPPARRRLFAAVMPLRTLVSIAAALLLLVSAPACSHVANAAAPETGIQLNGSAPALQLEQDLPLGLVFNDHMGVALVAELPSALDTENAGTVDGYRAGDVAYWAPEHSIIVFLSDGTEVPREGLVMVGHVAVGLNRLADCVQNCPVRLDDSD